MGSRIATFDGENFALREIRPYQGKLFLTTDLAKILSRVPKKYRRQVARRLSELHKSHI